MKFSYQWLQSHFDTPLPTPEILADKITFHSSEIEELVLMDKEAVLDVKVLPDKSAWLMSHRGLAKEISVMFGIPMKKDYFIKKEILSDEGTDIKIELKTSVCDFYGAALIKGVKVGPSPDWLRKYLETVGQRSINNIVDATNYVMFELGQPLHAFDAEMLGANPQIVVRQAMAGESFTTLSKETLTLDENDAVIADGSTGQSLALAGVKGGLVAGVTEDTTNILLESAHFNRVAVRKTARKYKLVTDAAKRYENGLATEVAPIALKRVVELVQEVAGGKLVGVKQVGEMSDISKSVSVPLAKINSVLGLALKIDEVEIIVNRFGFQYEILDEVLTVTPPFERDDINIAEDLIEEIGRMYGLDQVVSVLPQELPLLEFNNRHYYAEKIRTALCELGFSEVYTSSFQNKDIVKLENSLATDKGFLRSSLIENLKQVRKQNIPHRDLLGLPAVKVFEIGTVFLPESEEFRVCLAVQTGTEYKAKLDEKLLLEALTVISETCGVTPTLISSCEGVAEFSLEEILKLVPAVTSYEPAIKSENITYQPFSNYPAISRDVAMWLVSTVTVEKITEIIRQSAGLLCVRLSHLDTFTKEGRISVAFRLVFQAKDRTLTDDEVQIIMKGVYSAITGAGCEQR